MKRILQDNSGIALVTSLMLTLISLTIVTYLLLMVTSGIKQSGANKRYRTALEASYGATELLTKQVLPYLFTSTLNSGRTDPGTATASLFASSLNFTPGADACLLQKLTSDPSNWTGNCSSSSNAKELPDFTMKLNSTSSDPFTVYTKIVSTLCSDKRTYADGGRCTNSDLSGVENLDADSTGPAVMSMPAIYRVEIQAERSSNPQERSKLSLLYAY